MVAKYKGNCINFAGGVAYVWQLAETSIDYHRRRNSHITQEDDRAWYFLAARIEGGVPVHSEE